MAFGQLGPGFEQLPDQLAEGNAGESAKRHLILIPDRGAAPAAAALRQRVVMTAQKAQAGGCAPPPHPLRATGGETPCRQPRWTGAMREVGSIAQPACKGMG
jgi:hypothetical protein